MKQLILLSKVLAMGVFLLLGLSAKAQTTFTVGASGTNSGNSYTTIALAYAAVPSTPTGGYVIELQSDYAGEGYPITLGLKTGATSGNDITIQPASNASISMISTTGASVTGLTFLNSANSSAVTLNATTGLSASTSYMISGGTIPANSFFATPATLSPTINISNLITSANTAGTTATITAGTTVFKLNGAKYVTINGVNGAGTLTVGSTTTSVWLTADASNNTISNLTIKNYSGLEANSAILISTPTNGNSNNTISNCTFTADGRQTTAIFVNDAKQSGTKIQNNNILNIGTSGGSSITSSAIRIISTTGAGSEIIGNKLYWNKQISLTSSGTFNGINVSEDDVKIQNNTIGYADANGTGTAELTAGGGSTFNAYYIAVALAQTFSGNKFANFTIRGNYDGTTLCTGIFLTSAGAGTFSNNTIDGISLRQNASTTSIVNVQQFVGIYNTSTNSTAKNFSGNIIKKCTMSSPSNATNCTGIVAKVTGIQQTTTASASIYSNNQIYGLSAGYSTSVAANAVYGINLSANTGNTILIERNLIYNLTTSSTTTTTTGVICGIQTVGGNTGTTIQNNMIDLGNSFTLDNTIYGIYQGNATATSNPFKYYHNSVYVGGTAQTSATMPTYAFYRTGATVPTTNEVKNNILANQRTNTSGSAAHYAIAVAATTDLSVCNYNLYWANTVGLIGATPKTTFATDWKLALTPPNDANSYSSDPKFIDATNSTTPNLSIANNIYSDADAKGDIVTVTNDYFGTARVDTTPTDIGAHAYIYIGTVSTTTATSITGTTASSGGNITNVTGNPVTAKGVCWSTTSPPTLGAQNFTNDGSGTGIFTSKITNLLQSTTYYYRSYATTNDGTAYGSELSFTTNGPPVLGTGTSISTYGTSSASIINSSVISEGGETATRGVCWSTSSLPTVGTSNFTSDGTGTGTFASSISGLATGTKYYVRAYATNTAGTSYGNEVSFTTKQWTIGASAATADGNVSGAGDFVNNATVTLTATATVAGKRFVSWTESGTVVSINRTLTFSATSNRTLVANFGDVYTTYYVRPAGSTKWSTIGAAADQIITATDAANNFNLAFLADNTPDGTATYYMAAGNYTLVNIVLLQGTRLTTGKIYGGFSGDESAIDLNARATSDLDGNGIVEPWELTNATVINGRAGLKYAENGSLTTGERLIRIDNGGEVNGVTFTDYNYGSYGGAISVGLAATTPTLNGIGNEGYLKRCIIKKIKSYNGAVMSTNTNSVIDQCLIEDCLGVNYGAIYFNHFGGTVSNSVIRNNSALAEGGAIYAGNGLGNWTNGALVDLKAIIKNCLIYNNSATTKGGAISSKSGDATHGGIEIINSTIANNATGSGNASVEFDGPGLIVNSIVTGDAKADLYASSTTNYVGGVSYGTLSSSSAVLNASNTTSGKNVAAFKFTNATASPGYLELSGTPYDAMRMANFSISSSSSSAAIASSVAMPASAYAITTYGSIPTTDIVGNTRTNTLGAYQFSNFVTYDGTAWSNVSGPTVNIEAIIDGTFSGAGFTAKKLTINSGKSFTVNSGTNVTVQNEVINNGTLTNAGTLTVSGTLSNASTITNSGLIDNSAGTITNTGTLKNTSSASATGYLLSGGSTGNVTQERYLSSNQRGWRLLSNPLATTTFGILASGSTTPFTLGASTSGAYDSATNTWSNGVDADNMTSQQAYKVFIRGISSEVTASSYSVTTPSNVTISVTGTAVNSVPTAVTTTTGKYYLVANPYTAPVSVLSIIAASTGLSNSVSYYNPAKASSDAKIKAGGYDAVPVSGVAGSSNDVVLPPMGAIFVQASSAGIINIPKSAIYTGAIFGGSYNQKTANAKSLVPTALTINVNSNGVDFDKLQLRFKEVGAIGSNIDFGKLPNSTLNFYSIDGTTNKAISELELKEQTIPLGITSTALQGFTFNIAKNSIPSGFEASLVDNLLNTTTALATGTNYNFNLDIAPTSQGTARFAITLKATNALSVKENVLDSKIEMWPNPAHNQVYILNNLLEEGDTSYKIYSISGQLIHGENAVAGSTTTINTNGWAPGVYLLDVTNNGNKTTKKLIIQ